ncbi:MAG: hypothetical protein ACPGNV_05155 [Mangrovicoccus sp.]
MPVTVNGACRDYTRTLAFYELPIAKQRLFSSVDRRAALEDFDGVYLITDIHTGRRYIGSAYGDLGIWSRWHQYIDTEHGGNVELTRLVREQGLCPIAASIFALPCSHNAPPARPTI